MPVLLQWLGAWLAILAFLTGLVAASTSVVIAVLRHRFPTGEEQRAFLLRGRVYHGKEYHFPRLSEMQRLERLRFAGWGLAIFFLIYPSSVVTELGCCRMGWLSINTGLNHPVILKIRLAISLFSLAFVLTFGAYALAVGWLASGILRQSRTDSQATSAA